MPRTSEEAKARFRVERLELYYDRKENEECVQCGALLPEDADTVFCKECAELKREYARNYAATEQGKKQQRKYERERREAWRARNDAGDLICCKCGGAIDESRRGKRHCGSCKDENTRATTAWRERKKQGIVSIDAARRKKAAEERAIERADRERRPRRAPRPSSNYRPIEAILESTRYVLLSTIVRFDWFSATDLYDALDLPAFEDSRKERDRFSQTLSRYVRSGLIAYRTFHESGGGAYTGKKPEGLRNGGTYRITEDGRSALADMRHEMKGGIAC